jgi:hypothetical protein
MLPLAAHHRGHRHRFAVGIGCYAYDNVVGLAHRYFYFWADIYIPNYLLITTILILVIFFYIFLLIQPPKARSVAKP